MSEVPMEQDNIDAERLTHDMSQVSLELFDITGSNYEEILNELEEALQPSVTEAGLESQRQLIGFVTKATKKLTLQ